MENWKIYVYIEKYNSQRWKPWIREKTNVMEKLNKNKYAVAAKKNKRVKISNDTQKYNSQ